MNLLYYHSVFNYFLIRILQALLFFISSLLFLVISCSSGNKNISQEQVSQDTWWQQKAEKMVSTQIVSRGVTDRRVIQAMKSTPRHEFVPPELIDYAYNDYPLSIGAGQTISQPYIVALMTELLKLQGNEKVLEIGTGSGYQAAILSHLVDTCYTIEVIQSLANNARSKLYKMGYNNIVVRWGDGYKGWPAHAPFDAIIITAAPEEIPEELVKQLKVGGRMVLPVGKFYQNLILIRKTDKGIKKQNIIPVRFVPMVHPDQPIPENSKAGEK